MHTQFGMTLAISRRTLWAVEFHRRRAYKLALQASPRAKQELAPKLKLLDKAVIDLRERCFMLETKVHAASPT